MAVAIVRWFCALLGGVLLGSGLVLHGQVAMYRHMRDEVDRTFFLWRAIGNATFVFQSGEHRLALSLAEVPEEAIKESDRSAWVLVIVGSLVALTGPLLRPAGPTRTKKAKPAKSVKPVKQVARKP